MKYETEIDGVRALAVIGVLLFHLGVPFIAGGFIGVDVFFVLRNVLFQRFLFETRPTATSRPLRSCERLFRPLLLTA